MVVKTSESYEIFYSQNQPNFLWTQFFPISEIKNVKKKQKTSVIILMERRIKSRNEAEDNLFNP